MAVCTHRSAGLGSDNATISDSADELGLLRCYLIVASTCRSLGEAGKALAEVIAETQAYYDLGLRRRALLDQP